MIDGSNIRAHQHAAGAMGGQDQQALGRSRGGFGTKIHAKVDALGMPLRIRLTGGEAHELPQATRLYASDYCEYLLADKAYDSGEFRGFLKDRLMPGHSPQQDLIQYLVSMGIRSRIKYGTTSCFCSRQGA